MKSFIVIGCGRFGSSVAKNLYELENEVMVVDKSEELINDIADDVTYSVVADVSDEKSLKSLGLGNFDIAIIAIGSDLEASVIATLAAKELGVPYIIAKANSEMHSRILERIGADKVVYPEQDMGLKIAHSLNSTNVIDFIEFSPEYNMVELKALRKWEGKSLGELALPDKYSITVIAIRRGEEIRLVPKSNDIILKEDILVVIGHTRDVDELEKQLSKGK